MSQAMHGGNLIAAGQHFHRAPESFIDFSSNLNIGLEPILPDRDEILRNMMAYPEVDAHRLRERIAQFYSVNLKHLLPTSGAAEALYLALRLFAGQRIGIIEPGFSDYHRASRAAGTSIISIVLSPEEWYLPITQLIDKFRDCDVIVLGNPNNPTGHFHPRPQMLEVMQSLPEKAWIIDEAFIEFIERYEDQSLLSVLAELPALIVLGSLTKSWRVPGLRLGFLATANFTWLEKTALWQPPWSVNGIAQLWAQHNLTPQGWKKLQFSLIDLPERRRRFAAELSNLRQVRVHPTQTNFFLVELLTTHAATIYQALGAQGLLVRVCDSFTGIPAHRFIRLAVRNEQENRHLVQALKNFFQESAS